MTMDFTALMKMLSKETNPAVIFGHIHRRQRELASVLIQKMPRATRSYETATVDDLLDNEFIIGFFYTLSGNQHLLDDSATMDVTTVANVARGNATLAAEISDDLIEVVHRDAASLAFRVMWPHHTSVDTYSVCADADLPEAA